MPPSRERTGWSRGKWIAAIFAIAINVAFVAFLFFSATWQNRKPEAVSVDLYAPPGPAPAKTTQAKAPEPAKPPPEPPKPPPEPAKPPPEPVKEPEPPPKAEPPKPVPPPPLPEPPKPVPKVEPPAPSKADIALKEKQEKERIQQAQAERAREEALKKEVEKREAEKRDAEKKKLDAEKKKVEEKRLAEVRERQARESAALAAQADREHELAVSAARAAQAKANADYVARIQAKVRGNVVLPPDIPGNPEAVFDVVQLPTGEILDAHLRKSSGVRAYDDAVQRAIIKSSPLPRPASPDLFQRELTLRFRPQD